MGFYGKYWSTLLKGPGATRFKIRWEVGKIIKYSNMASDLLFHKFPYLIEKSHRVTYFLKQLIKFITAVKKVGDNCFKVLFNESTQDMTEIKEVEGILQEIGEFWQKMPRNKIFKRIELEFLLHIIRVLKSEEIQERDEYKLVEAIINESVNPGKKNQDFMAMVRNRFKRLNKKKLENIFEKITWRREVRISRNEINAAHKLKKDLWVIFGKIMKVKEDSKLGPLAAELEKKLDDIKVHVGKMFRESYLVKERAFLMVLRIVYLCDYAAKYLKITENKHFIPVQPSDEKILELKLVVKHIGDDFNKTIAQEFRIVIHDVEKLEQEAEVLRRQQ